MLCYVDMMLCSWWLQWKWWLICNERNTYFDAGNPLGVYPSGISVATALGVQQGDISLCCRGLKYSVANHRFRFLGDTEDQFEVVKRRKLEMAAAALLDPPDDPLLGGSGRSRRVSRGDYHVKVSDKEDHPKPSKNKHQYSGPKVKEVAHIMVRQCGGHNICMHSSPTNWHATKPVHSWCTNNI